MGVNTVNLQPASSIDSLLGNRDGTTVQIGIELLAALIAAQVPGPQYETRAALYADLEWPANTRGTVWGDATEAWRGIYKKAGAAGSGSWSRIGDLPMTSVAIAALAAKAPLASPVLTGTPTGPTPPGGDDSTRLATTAFVQAAMGALISAAPGALDTLNELAAALGDDPNFAATMAGALAAKAPLASPALTGAPTAPTAAPGSASTQIATTAFVQAAATAAIEALVASAPGALDTLNELAAALGDDPNFAATMAGALAARAPLASPSLTGTPTAPTAALGTDTTQIATAALLMTTARALAQQSGVIVLTGVGGTGDAATASLPGLLAGVSITNDMALSIRWPGTNTADDPKLTLGGVTYTVKGQRGQTLPAGRLVTEGAYVLRRHSATILKLTSALDRSDVGLWNVENLAPADLPLSNAAMTARDALRRRAAGATLTTGEAATATSNYYQMLAGASAITAPGGRVTGLTIPAGQTGAGSFVTPRIDIADRAAELAGYTVRLITVAEISAGMLAVHPLAGAVRVDHVGGGVDLSVGVLEEEVVADGYLRRTMLYTMTGTEARIGQVIQIAGGSVVAGVDHSLEVVSLTWQPALDATNKATSAADLARAIVAEDEARRMIGVATLSAPGMQAPVTVAPGAGTPVQDALDAARGKPDRLALIQLAAGTFFERSIQADAGYVEIRGQGQHCTLIDGSQPDNATVGDVEANSTLDLHKDLVVYRDFTALMRNGRYVLHLDDHVADARVVLKNVTLRHEGNVASGWVSQHALGHGSWSGTELRLEDCHLSGPRAALQFHNNVGEAGTGQAHPSMLEALRCPLIARNVNGYAALVQPLGSGVQDRLLLEGCPLVGNILIDASQWHRTDGYQPAHRSAEIKVCGTGNTPAVVQVIDPTRALRIDSLTTGSGSSVQIGGSAAAILFGMRQHGRDGATGVAGFRYGDIDIGSTPVGPAANVSVSLGARLGNRSGAPVYLEITLDGTLRTVTFNGNHTAASNATILGMINAAISGVGIASEYAAGQRHRPVFTDEEALLLNDSGTHIRWMAPLAFDGNRRKVRIMTAADPFIAFAGLCWEPEGIWPGDHGRVKRRGWISRQDLIDGGVENGAPAVAYGEWYVPWGTSGMVDANSAPSAYTDGILQVARFDAGQPATWTALELRGTR